MKEEFMETGDMPEPEGRYADAFRIGHSAYKFIFDFGQFTVDRKVKQFHTRIITGPDVAVALEETLRESLEQFKEKYEEKSQQYPEEVKDFCPENRLESRE